MHSAGTRSQQGTAVVLTEKDVKNAGMDGVFADEFRGAYEGICRLIEKGCKRIGIAVGQTGKWMQLQRSGTEVVCRR